MWAGCASVQADSQTEVTTPDVALAELAAGQHGVVTLAQLQALGFGAGSIKYRRGIGRLHLLHRGFTAWGTAHFEKDRDRDADLLNAGFPTIRVTDHRLKHHRPRGTRLEHPPGRS